MVRRARGWGKSRRLDDLVTTPTFAQEDYAAALVRRLREANLFEADGYGRKVVRCESRAEMSRLIEEMKTILRDVEEGE